LNQCAGSYHEAGRGMIGFTGNEKFLKRVYL